LVVVDHQVLTVVGVVAVVVVAWCLTVHFQ
jgi:hypothetical protein